MSMVLSFLAGHWLAIAAVAVLAFALFMPGGPALLWRFKAWVLCAAIAWWGWTGHAALDALELQVAKDKAEAATKALDTSAAFLADMREVSGGLYIAASRAASNLNEASNDYRREAGKRPLGAGCAPGQGRQDAVNRTLSGAKPPEKSK